MIDTEISYAIKQTIKKQIESVFEDRLVEAITNYDFTDAIKGNIDYVLETKLGDYLDGYIEEAVTEALEEILEDNIG